MIATEMPAAMRPYSIAVAPDSSFTKREKMVFMIWLLTKIHTWLSELTQRLIDTVWIVGRTYGREISTALNQSQKPASRRAFRLVVNIVLKPTMPLFAPLCRGP